MIELEDRVNDPARYAGDEFNVESGRGEGGMNLM